MNISETKKCYVYGQCQVRINIITNSWIISVIKHNKNEHKVMVKNPWQYQTFSIMCHSFRNIPSTSNQLKMLKGAISFAERARSATGGHGSRPLSSACCIPTALKMASIPLLWSPVRSALVERKSE